MAELFGLDLNSNGFLASADEFLSNHDTKIEGLFLTGTCRAPKNLEETLNDARSAAIRIHQYFTLD
jgi:heterodisulfide reductase subunit A-like polyferredoxin